MTNDKKLAEILGNIAGEGALSVTNKTNLPYLLASDVMYITKDADGWYKAHIEPPYLTSSVSPSWISSDRVYLYMDSGENPESVAEFIAEYPKDIQHGND